MGKIGLVVKLAGKLLESKGREYVGIGRPRICDCNESNAGLIALIAVLIRLTKSGGLIANSSKPWS